jgi:DNA invertase Pin-like site-specific DNA recombinase
LSRSVAFIATLMDSKGFDLAIADMPGANRLTLHVLAAAAEHERHMIGERTRHALAAAKARGVKLAIQSRARSIGRRQPNGLKCCVRTSSAASRLRTSSNAIAADLNARGIAAPNGGQWFPMQVHRARRRLGL